MPCEILPGGKDLIAYKTTLNVPYTIKHDGAVTARPRVYLSSRSFRKGNCLLI